ncbi:VOC family protein [Clostridium estertheticum]|uniref:VOC family protein n=1 Tax=Clostridium estertheticum TaxID=238834 RepID=A0AA47EPL1_9CLOT|nr:VOC family protein [Clostridium estertheticum]MBU3158073.1 VOC family protein [Clostridium estertheticum]WAG63199.1 VOC family protein [Clostridium estertheticum]
MIPKIKLQSVVLDCKQPAKLARFYSELLGGKIVYEIECFVAVSIPGESISISCQFEENYISPAWPDSREEQMKMAHLDFSVEDVETSMQFALSLGATKPLTQYWQPELGSQWITLLDPVGHPFCLCVHGTVKE